MRKLRAATAALAALLVFGWLGPAAWATASDDTQPPTTPTNLHVTDTTANTVRLAWDPSTDDSGTVRYRVIQDDYPHDGTLAEPRAFVYGLFASSGHTFRVQAEDASGNVSARSAPLSVTTDPADTQPPTAPANLRVTGTTSSSVSLAWEPSTDNPGGEGLLGYWVQWDGGTTHGTGDTEYTWPGLPPGTHRFTVVAYDAAFPAGNTSPPSNEVTVTVG